MKFRPTPDELKEAYHIIDRERFWSKVDFNGPMQKGMPTCCWVWRGAHHREGHGVFRLRRRMPAGKAALLLSGQDVPDSMNICHRCDYPPCVRPEHLFLGSNIDNFRDMREKRRHAHGDRTASARLTDALVSEIIASYTAGARVLDLAHRYQVATNTISNIILGRTWTHLTGGRRVSRGRCRGSQHRSAQLTEDQVRRLRQQHANGTLNISQTARDLGVGRVTLQRALSGKSWTHI